MNTQPKVVSTGLDLLALTDAELTFVMESTVQHLASLKPHEEALIRFWGGVFLLLDEERQRRCKEIAELHRLYFL
jgi:hypothetical protein